MLFWGFDLLALFWGTSLVAQTVKNLPTMQGTEVQSPSWGDSLKKVMATHSSILAWKTPRTKEPGGLQSEESQRVRHDWTTNTLIISGFSKIVGMENRLCSAKEKCKLKKWSQLWRIFSISLPFEIFHIHCVNHWRHHLSLKIHTSCFLCVIFIQAKKKKKKEFILHCSLSVFSYLDNQKNIYPNFLNISEFQCMFSISIKNIPVFWGKSWVANFSQPGYPSISDLLHFISNPLVTHTHTHTHTQWYKTHLHKMIHYVHMLFNFLNNLGFLKPPCLNDLS